MIEENYEEQNEHEQEQEQQEQEQEQEQQEQGEVSIFHAILGNLPNLTRAEIAKIAREAVQLLEKGTVAKRASSMPKGVAPPHLAKASAWARHFQTHFTENGWETLRVEDKKTKQLIEYAGSKMAEDGKTHVFEDTGKPMSYVVAMKLSNTDAMQATDLYREWEESYIASGGVVVNKKSEEAKLAAEAEKKAERERVAAEKKAESERKKAEKLEQHKLEVAARAEERKRLSAEKKQQKEEEAKAAAEEKRRLKELEAADKKPKVTGVPAVLKAPAKPAEAKPVVTVAKAVPSTSSKTPMGPMPTASAVAPAAAVAPAVPRAKKAPAAPAWVPPPAGETKEFIFDDIHYYRDHEGYMWYKQANNTLGEFVGMFVNGGIDMTVEDPFGEEDEE